MNLYNKETLPKRFIDKINFTDSCWLWRSGKNKDNYVNCFYRGKQMGAHRASWMIYHGEIPKDMCVLHKCDVPCCINPDHLFLGTHKDNVDDKVSKGRHIKPSPTSRLTNDQMDEIRNMYVKTSDRKDKNRLSQRKLAEKFGISTTEINFILNNKSYFRRGAV